MRKKLSHNVKELSRTCWSLTVANIATDELTGPIPLTSSAAVGWGGICVKLFFFDGRNIAVRTTSRTMASDSLVLAPAPLRGSGRTMSRGEPATTKRSPTFRGTCAPKRVDEVRRSRGA
jgi:hypothetical protein